MNKELAEDEKLLSEYEQVFDGEEKSMDILKISNSMFTRTIDRVNIRSIGLSEPQKLSRQDTYQGLSKTVKELGVISPIHVMTTESYDEDSDDDDSYKFILLDGVRRMFSATKNGITEIDAVIWDFHDKSLGRDVALPLSLVLNRSQKRSWGEIWSLYRILELRGAIAPSTLEYLLQLESGDAMKLKDVMLCEYEEVKATLMSGDKSLDQCYKQLQKLRKEENQLAKEDEIGFSNASESAEEVVDGVGESDTRAQLSDEDTMELLEMAENTDNIDLDDSNFDGLNAPADNYVDSQKVGERHPLDPALRSAVLASANFRCKCCGKGGPAMLGILAAHHIIPVSASGKDTLKNLVCLCHDCHILIHIAERAGGSLPMDKSQFDEYDEKEKLTIKRIIAYANIAVKANNRKGLTKEQVVKATADAVRHKMPGEGLEENTRAYLDAQKASSAQN